MKIQEMSLAELKAHIRDNKISSDIIISFSKKAIIQDDGTYKIQDPKWHIKSEIIVNKGDLPNIKKDGIKTTLGRFLINKFLLVEIFGDFYEYRNETISINKFIEEVTQDLLIDNVTVQQKAQLLNHSVFLTRFSDMVVPGISERFMYTPPKTMKLKEELTKKYKHLLDSGDIEAIDKIEKKVMESLHDELKDDPTYQFYTREKPSFGNNLKQTIGVLSPIKDPVTGKLNYPEGNWSEGITPESYHLFSNMNINGTYSRAVGTADGGAIVTSLYNAMNVINCDEDKEYDCGTKRLKTVKLTDKNFSYFCWNYILVNGKLIVLTHKNKSTFINKEIKIRSSIFCEHSNPFKVCHFCAGELPYKTGILSVGNLTTKIGFNFVQISLKQFHDSTISVTTIDPFKYMSI